jgi:hypothetical protein
MDGQKLVDLLKLVVRDAAASGEMSVLDKPPGQKPRSELLERSAWYHSLQNDEKRILSSIIFDTATQAVFGFLCVLDGVRQIENGLDKGRFELRYINDGSVWLNSPEQIMLHELW